MAIVVISQMFARPGHVLWMLIQQFAVRGMIALKFLLAARLLGPDQIGLVGIATLSLAIVESLSDTGLAQAVVQSHNKINRTEAGAVWTLQLTRGVVVAVLLFVLSGPIAIVFKLPASASLIALAAAVPLLRNAFNPGIFLVQRDRNFRQLSVYEASAALLDLTSTMLLIHLGTGPASILLGNVASDSLKLVLTWTWCRTPLMPNFQWRLIKSLTSFGKWVWGSSVVTLVLNQLDKVLVARFLGAADFGLYQVASRIAQLVVADGAMALGQYLFPVFSEHHRVSKRAAFDYYVCVMKRLIPVAAFVALLLAALAKILLGSVIGPEWHAAAPVLQVMSISMFFGAVIGVTTIYFRAMGKPKMVTLAVLIQLVTLIVAAPLLISIYGSVGMAAANGVALLGAIAVFMIQIKRAKA